MSASLLHGSLVAAQAMLALAMLCAAWRMLVGPRAQDRVLAADALYIDAMLLILTIGMRTGSTLYFEAAMIIALVGFVSSVALAKFLLRGEVIE
jgi:multicomponent K+:H+ antiporter subunit F